MMVILISAALFVLGDGGRQLAKQRNRRAGSSGLASSMSALIMGKLERRVWSVHVEHGSDE